MNTRVISCVNACITWLVLLSPLWDWDEGLSDEIGVLSNKIKQFIGESKLYVTQITPVPNNGDVHVSNSDDKDDISDSDDKDDVSNTDDKDDISMVMTKMMYLW